jgi:DUF1365 family protein
VSGSSAPRSALYEGVVTHARPGVDGHAFSQKVRMAMLDLDEVDALCASHPLWSTRRWAPVRFDRADYLRPIEVPLSQAVGDVVERHSGIRPSGPISVLTNLQSWGWLFNPISCYFCFDERGSEVVAMVAEVTNTPWHDRHSYVVGPPGLYAIDKVLHVSPFLSMDQTYRLDYGAPAGSLSVSFNVAGPDGPSLFAGMKLARRTLSRSAMSQMALSPGRGAPGVSLGIYRQALSLWRKGATVHRHPAAHPDAAARSSAGRPLESQRSGGERSV